MEPGICYIKEEYLVPELKNNAAHQDPVEHDNKRKSVEDNATENGKPQKYQKTNKKERKRGQNKNRPVFKQDSSLFLCHSLMNGPDLEKCAHANCRYVHDLAAYLKSKPEDLGVKCPVFDAIGFCTRGVTCRFAKAHLDAEGRNIKSPHYDENKARTSMNGITSELQVRLRKREYDFTRSKQLVSQADKLRDERKKKGEVNDSENPVEDTIVEDKTTTEAIVEAVNSPDTEKPIGAVVDDAETGERDIAQKRPVDFAEKLILSPLTTVGNLPFRRICKEFGADITCGEMACAVPLVKGLTQEWALTKRHVSEDVFGVQLCGNNPNIIAQAAQLLQETASIDYIDLNIGCPIELIYQHGGGSALMRRTNILETIVRSCSAMSPKIPFTVKMRTGVYADKSVAHELMPLVEEWGAAAVTLHGRSREQRYMKSANWQYIEECAAKVKHIPVIGNGDILNFEDYIEKSEQAPHVSSVMIGRGALIKPWIFKEIREQKPWNPTSMQRFDILRTYVNYGLEHWGSDMKGVENTRRFLLEWQSFMYRYIPYELLANPPQQINQRPQKFRGRDEMETLMSSPNSTDWVRLSEMLLGPVPAGFKFVPKHKANAY
ncbi:PREDICTED: tRNA-dihydrouridine(47) synthase [NAD(P)(+)]-like isoform X1 [Bactrocera latifrons]|uniref:tRNA-dihydrouridine(47) synthase [NAD(P)(+)]-like isoform X1 n=1 Tax=Bactrocera latifrons TaxID=174628 RepID=UPI0008DD4446|nr:PREDICTED: tRNA-dihydrouridine(47) synthase [NAD(P)(+)]-like isoform X1 [Bactrocera latifrons]